VYRACVFSQPLHVDTGKILRNAIKRDAKSRP